MDTLVRYWKELSRTILTAGIGSKACRRRNRVPSRSFSTLNQAESSYPVKSKRLLIKNGPIMYMKYNLRSRPLWTDFHKNWHTCRSRRHNHSVQFWLQYFDGVSDLQAIKIFVFPLTLLVIVTTVVPLPHTAHSL